MTKHKLKNGKDLHLRRGMHIGKYRLQTRLGDGGFSEVWKARDTIENQWVALKFPTLSGMFDEEKLLREIRISVRLRHPNILRVRNADIIDNHYVLVTELATESLDERLSRRLAVPKALSYISQVLNGLSFAHRSHVIHRDIKPSNLLIFPNDQLRISDFGLAVITKKSVMSATGSGTVLYAAPEQMSGYPSRASVVFSVGIITYQLLTGIVPRWPFEWPFEGLPSLRKIVPAELISVLQTATQPNYRDRYSDAIQMLEEFDRAHRIYLRSYSKRKGFEIFDQWEKRKYKEFVRAFEKDLFLQFECPRCNGPISEHMHACPWCGLAGMSFGSNSSFAFYCGRCQHGVKKEWLYCPWCWGPALRGGGDGIVRPDVRYNKKCRSCKKPLIDGMRYCPWCRTKCSRRVLLPELPFKCRHCKSSVAEGFWEYCAWCGKDI